MAQIILHHKGVYNLYCSISDGCIFDRGITREELESYIREQHGLSGVAQLESRLERAHQFGTCSIHGGKLKDFIICNRAGENEKRLGYREFLARCLSLTPTTVGGE